MSAPQAQASDGNEKQGAKWNQEPNGHTGYRQWPKVNLQRELGVNIGYHENWMLNWRFVYIWSRLPPIRPPPNGLGPPGIHLYLVFCWYLVPLGIYTHAMHILKSNSLPTVRPVPTYVCVSKYIYIIPFIPDKQSCYIWCLYTTYILSTCYICPIYIKPVYYLNTI